MEETRSALADYLSSLDSDQLQYAYDLLRYRSEGLTPPQLESPWASEVRLKVMSSLFSEVDDTSLLIDPAMGFTEDDLSLLDLSVDARTQVDAALETLTKRLVDTSARNRLISFREFKSSSLRIEGAAPAEIWRILESKGQKSLLSSHLNTGMKRVPRIGQTCFEGSPSDLNQRASTLYRTQRSNLAEKGLHTLYLALGALNWSDKLDSTKVHKAPLLLIPVSLAFNAKREWRIEIKGEAQSNLPLRAFLKEKHHLLMLEAPAESKDFAQFLSSLELLFEDQPTLSLDRDFTQLVIASFAKEAMFEDLKSNSSKVKANPLIQVLISNDSSITLEGTRAGELSALPVLDADPSQRAAMDAAMLGESFVMFGPPGTGKSQTISNIIADSMRVGKRVLFVSEKKAALEAVHDNLRKVDLDDHALILHGVDVNRKEVSESLLKVINASQAISPLEAELGSLEGKAAKLEKYGQALNAPLGNLGKSIYQLSGDLFTAESALSKLGFSTIDRASGVDIRELTPAKYLELLDRLNQLEDVWETWCGTNPWSKINPVSILEGDLAEIRARIRVGLEDAEKSVSHSKKLSQSTGVEAFSNPAMLNKALNLQELLRSRPAGVTPEMTDDISGTCNTLRVFSHELKQLKDYHSTLVRVLGEAGALEPSAAKSFQKAHLELSKTLKGNSESLDSLTLSDLEELISNLSENQFEVAKIESLGSSLLWLLQAKGMLSSQEGLTFGQAKEISNILNLLEGDGELLPAWLSPKIWQAAKSATKMLKDAAALEVGAKEEAMLFSAKVLEDEFKPLAEEILVLDGLSSFNSYERKLRKRLKAFTRNGKVKKNTLTSLPFALAYHQAHQQRKLLETKRAKVLGRLYSGLETNWSSLEDGLKRAERVLESLKVAPELKELTSLFKEENINDISLSADALERAFKNYLKAPQVGLYTSKLGSLEMELSDFSSAHVSLFQAFSDLREKFFNAFAHLERNLSLKEALSCSEVSLDSLFISEQIQAKSSFYQNALGEFFDGLQTSPEGALELKIWFQQLALLEDGNLKLDSRELADVLVTPLDILSTKDAIRLWEQAYQCLKTISTFEAQDELQRVFEFNGNLPSWISQLTTSKNEGALWRDALEVIDSLAVDGHAQLLGSLRKDRVSKEVAAFAFKHALLSKALDLSESTHSTLGVRSSKEALEKLRQEYQELDSLLSSSLGPSRVRSEISKRWQALRPDMLKAEKVIVREANKKMRHKHLRELFDDYDYTKTVQTLKPCLMMSPLSVSQYLPQGVDFDLVIFDEASQVRLEDALTSVYRGKQLIVAGDSKQMPPSDFFSEGVSSEELLDTELVELVDSASLLDLAQASPGMKTRALRWHYRSQHESLIYYSAENYYKSQDMVIFPAPATSDPLMGVKFNHVKDGIFTRGGDRTNKAEAEVVVEMVLENLSLRPQESLGIVAMSSTQAEMIRNLLEERAAKAKVTIDFEDPFKGVFVKNLENVQGDERDVIFLSVGYAADSNGKLPSQFGPLSRQGGERRLNVAVTRAKRRLHVVSSLTYKDIPERLKGARELRNYLQYAEQGTRSLYQAKVRSSSGDSFKDQVALWLQLEGFMIEKDLSVNGFSIDIAVRHPKHPNRFIAALSCDGARYQAVPDLRTRERLLSNVLKMQGWNQIRLWAPSWARDSQKNKKEVLRELRGLI